MYVNVYRDGALWQYNKWFRNYRAAQNYIKYIAPTLYPFSTFHLTILKK